MNNKTTIPITEGRNKIFEIAKQVQRPETHYTLTQRGRPSIVVMSVEEYESLKETIEVMKEIPVLDEEIKRAEKEYDEGSFVTLEDFLSEKGFTKNAR